MFTFLNLNMKLSAHDMYTMPHQSPNIHPCSEIETPDWAKSEWRPIGGYPSLREAHLSKISLLKAPSNMGDTSANVNMEEAVEAVDVFGNQLVVHQPSASSACVVASSSSGSDYSAAVQGILLHFRAQTEEMLQAQLHHHHHPGVDRNELLQILHADADAQLEIQQRSEHRLQAAVANTHADTTRAMVSRVDSHAAGTKRDIEEGVCARSKPSASPCS